MSNEIIEECKLKLIKKYGDPTPSIVNGKTYRILNENLEEFNHIVTLLEEIGKKVNEQIPDDVVELVCDYCLVADLNRIMNIRKSLTTLNNSFSYNKSAKNTAHKLLADLTNNKEDINKNILKLINYFRAHLKINLGSTKRNHIPDFTMNR